MDTETTHSLTNETENASKKKARLVGPNESIKSPPHFLVIGNSSGESKRMSPFLIHEYIKYCSGESKNVKRLRSGDILIETANNAQSTSLLALGKIGQISVSVSAHNTLNFSRGVISEYDLISVSEQEFIEELAKQCVRYKVN